MMDFSGLFSDFSGIVLDILLIFGLGLLLVFFIFFLLPGLWRLRKLWMFLYSIKKIKDKTKPEGFKQVFAADKQLAHLWKEYEETLHKQKEEYEGQMRVVKVRATVPASAFFNEQFIVDSRLYTEFFKHLPGILTGLGIIGTFFGLIDGLEKFQVTDDAATVRTSLEVLMKSVSHAFTISAIAIGAAIVVTVFEKILLSALYKKTEDIAQSVDACFESGAGEEYLSRLVKTSEETTSQSKILKDALVKDLGDILRDISAAQLSAADRNRQELGEVIACSIERSFKEPLDKIANSVATASGDQSSAAVTMLNDVMVGFSQKLNELFGGQISGINELNQQTAKGMQDAVAALNTLVGRLEDSGQKTANEMAAQMAASIKMMEERQSSINTQTQDCVDQIRQLILSSQTETQQKLQATLDALGQQMTDVIGNLNSAQARAFEDNRAREELMAERNSAVVAGMATSVEGVVKEIAIASQSMAQTVATLTSTTTSNIDKMSASANRIDTATMNFADAGNRVSAAMAHAATVSNKLAELSGSLDTSSSALRDALGDYKAQRDAVGRLVTELRTTVELAKKEASLTADVLQRIELSASKLNEAQNQAKEYLEGVNRVLVQVHDGFRESITKSLSTANNEFHNKLSGAVGLLAGSIEELEQSLSNLPLERKP